MKPLLIGDITYAWVNHYVDINEHTAARVPMAYYRNIDDPTDEIVYNSQAQMARKVDIKIDIERRNRRPDNGSND